MKTEFLNTIPVLPSLNVARDVDWYREKMGLEVFFADNMYAVLFRENLCLHLQWHADTEDDPLLGGSVVRISVKNILPLFEEFVQRGAVTTNKFLSNTAWNTNEFGFYDLNKNAIFIMEDVKNGDKETA
ncbi:MAG: glyoxalase/bleomycin resistance/extradiol dioxygenase family protein [Saprospiraceae bacterium]|nr:glyoxalase/bleomycin resistance/extradiol dioxygenase family protein [Saprospiraceae bacterium]